MWPWRRETLATSNINIHCKIITTTTSNYEKSTFASTTKCGVGTISDTNLQLTTNNIYVNPDDIKKPWKQDLNENISSLVKEKETQANDQRESSRLINLSSESSEADTKMEETFSR